MLSIIPAGLPRAISEVLISAIPGALLQFFFVTAAAGLNIWSTQAAPNEGTYALVYLPIICFLPIVVGAVSTLVYERVQGVHTAHLKGSIFTAATAAFVGTLMGALIIVVSGAALKVKPLGAWGTDIIAIVALPAVMVVVSTVLAIVGAAVVGGVLNKMEK